MQDGVRGGAGHGQPLPHDYTGGAASNSYQLEILKRACQQKVAHQAVQEQLIAQSVLQHQMEQRANSATASTTPVSWAPATTSAVLPQTGLHPHPEATLQQVFRGKQTLQYDPAPERGARPAAAMLPGYTWVSQAPDWRFARVAGVVHTAMNAVAHCFSTVLGSF